MTTRARCIRLVVIAALAAAGCVSGAQAASRWPGPERSYSLDFASAESPRQPLFDDRGFAWEIPLDFLMVAHPRVTVKTKLPGPGRFDVVQANPQARVQLEPKGPDAVDVVAELLPMSIEDARKQAWDKMMDLAKPLLEKIAPEAKKAHKDDMTAFLKKRNVEIPRVTDRDLEKKEREAKELEALRQAYVHQRTIEELAPELRRLLPEIAAAHPAWVNPKDRVRWDSAGPQEIGDEYCILAGYEIMDEYLKRCGLGVDSNIPAYRARLDTRINAVYVILAGKVGEDPVRSEAISQAFANDESDRLRETLSVRLRCRFFPAADPQDPNSQWFAAQRVGCRVKGAKAVRLEGTLNPAEHDAADWWFLDGYNPGVVILKADENPDVRLDGPFPCEGGARLNVAAAANKPLDYGLEFHPVGDEPGEGRVVIRESPGWAEAKFPF